MFTAAEKARIRRYLGFSQGFHDVDTRLEGQLDTLPSTYPEAETQVREILALLATVDTKLHGAMGSLKIVRIVGEVEFRGPEEITALQAYGSSLITRLAITFNIEMADQPDYYGVAAGMGGGISLG